MCKSIKSIICYFVILCLLGSQSVAAETIYYYHTDPVGTPLAMTDEGGAKVWEADYLPFGEVYTESGLLNDRKFVGKERDEESDLDYFGARFHYAKVGRFLAVDPVRAVDTTSGQAILSLLDNPQRQNVYAYSLNNPYKYVDPDGRDIAFVVDPLAAGGNGHTTLYFQNGQGLWFSYNQGAAGDTSSGSGNLGFLAGSSAPAGADIEAKMPPSNAVTIKTTKKQNTAIAESAIKSRDDHNNGKTNYNLYSNNCTDAAVDVVNNSKVGIKIPNSSTTVKPNSWFKELKNAKSKGSI